MKKYIILFFLLFLNLVFTSCGKRVVVWKRPVPSKNLMLQALAEISGVFIETPSYGYKKEEKEINDLSYLINFLNLIKQKNIKNWRNILLFMLLITIIKNFLFMDLNEVIILIIIL